VLARPLRYSAIDPPGRPRAVVVVLHGFGASGDDFRPIVPQLDLPAALGVRFVFPDAPEMPVSLMGGQRARAWFDFQLAPGANLAALAAGALGAVAGAAGPDGFGALVEGSASFPGLDKAALRVRDLLQSEIDDGVPAERIVLAGFSQGGALALHAGLLYPRPLAGVLALSTFLADRSTLGAPRTRANANTPILMCHGQRDAVLPMALGRRGHDQLQGAGYRVEWQDYAMGHEVCAPQLAAIGLWLRRVLAT